MPKEDGTQYNPAMRYAALLMATMAMSQLLYGGQSGVAPSPGALSAGRIPLPPVATQASQPRALPAPTGEFSIADFTAGLPAGVTATGGALEWVKDSNASAGAGCARLTMDIRKAPQARLTFSLPPQVKFNGTGELSACVRVDNSYGELDMRWLALDGEGKVLRQRRFGVQVRQAEGWTQLCWPLCQWRWGNERVGRWDEVRALVLVVENQRGQICLDGVRIRPGEVGDANYLVRFQGRQLAVLAFGASDANYRLYEEGDVLVGTNAGDVFSSDDLHLLGRQIGQVDAWMGRVFGASYRPVTDAPPAAMLIFRDSADYSAFFRRLGQAWNVNIAPPSSAGYTVQGVSASTYNRRFGIRRPVYIHEAVHSLAARNIRLRPGVRQVSWLQEGLANYIQVGLYPSSLDVRTYVTNFALPIDPRGKGVFVPLHTLFAGPVEASQYAQAASVVAFLLEKHPEWMAPIARDLADGCDSLEAFKRVSVSPADVQKEWLEWGRKAYPPDDKRMPGDTVFRLPKELRPAEASK